MLTLTNGAELTPTEDRILDLLKDGLPHHAHFELQKLLPDELSDRLALNNHLCRLRKKLKGEIALICEFRRRNLYYRLVRLIGDAKKLKVLGEYQKVP